jgi:hypothetical protein
MPTYQTAPLLPPKFPTLVRNPYGFQPLRGNTLAYADLPAAGDSYHPSWKKQADLSVMTRLENNYTKELDMLRGPASQKSNVPFTTKRGPDGHVLSGGVVNSKDAESKIQSLLRDRKFQLDAIQSASFDAVAPERVKEPETVTDTFSTDQTFGNLLSSLSEGIITTSLLSYTAQIMNFFLTKADKIPDHKFAEYDGFLQKLAELLNGAFYSAAEAQSTDLQNKQTRILKKLEKDILAMSQFIGDFTQYLGSPTKTKSMRLAAIRNRLLSLITQSAQAGIEAAVEIQRQYEEGERFGPDGPGDDEDGAPPPGGDEEGSQAPSSFSGTPANSYTSARVGRPPVVDVTGPQQRGLEAFGFGPQPAGQGLFRRKY